MTVFFDAPPELVAAWEERNRFIGPLLHYDTVEEAQQALKGMTFGDPDIPDRCIRIALHTWLGRLERMGRLGRTGRGAMSKTKEQRRDELIA